jgi:hypothetical protein
MHEGGGLPAEGLVLRGLCLDQTLFSQCTPSPNHLDNQELQGKK